MPPSGTAITTIAVAMTSASSRAESQKSLSAKMNSKAPTPTARRVRHEERRVEQALIEDEPEREEDGECRHQQ